MAQKWILYLTLRIYHNFPNMESSSLGWNPFLPDSGATVNSAKTKPVMKTLRKILFPSIPHTMLV